MSMQSVQSFFDDLLNDIDPNIHTEYKLRVGCIKMAAPRDPRFDFVREIGLSDIDAIFSGKPFLSNELTFCFPERYMSVHEQQAFMLKLERHPDFQKIKSVDILTSSPLLIGSFKRESIRILQWENDYLYSGGC